MKITVGHQKFHKLHKDVMDHIDQYNFSGMTVAQIFQVAYYCREAYNQSEGGPTASIICDNLLLYKGKVHISYDLAAYLIRFWFLPQKDEADDLVFCDGWEDEWTQPISQPSIKGILSVSNAKATDNISDETGDIPASKLKKPAPFVKYTLSGISTTVLSLFVGMGTHYGQAWFRAKEGKKPLSELYPRYAVMPASVNCRTLTDSQRIQSDGPQAGMMETISGVVKMHFATEKYYAFPYTPECCGNMGFDRESLLVPTNSCMDTEWNIIKNGNNLLRAAPMNDYVKKAYSHFYGKGIDTGMTNFGVNNTLFSPHQRYSMYLGLVLEGLTHQLSGLVHDKDWIQLHSHCARLGMSEEKAEAQFLVPTPRQRRVIYGQTMVMFGSIWRNCSISALDGNNRLTSSRNAMLQIYPQRTADEVIRPRRYPRLPIMALIGSLSECTFVLPSGKKRNGRAGFEVDVFEMCKSMSDRVQTTKHDANESSVVEFVQKFFNDEMENSQDTLHHEWLMGEIMLTSDGKCLTKNSTWWVHKMENLVGRMKGRDGKGMDGLPPLLKKEMGLIEMEGGNYKWRPEWNTLPREPLVKVLPTCIENFKQHENFPILQAVVSMCCYTPFWDAGAKDGARVLKALQELASTNGMVKSSLGNEYVRALRSEGTLYRAQVSHDCVSAKQVSVCANVD